MRKVDPYQPHEKQKEFHDSKARFRFVVAGVRGGKTTAGACEALKTSTKNPGSHGWIVGPTFPLLETARRTFIQYGLTIPGVIRRESRSQHAFYMAHDSFVELKSAEWPEGLRAAGLDWIWIDEGALIKKEAWENLLQRVADRKGRIWVTTTPGPRNWLWKLFQSRRDDPNFDFFRFPTECNPCIDPEEIEMMRRTLPRTVFRRDFLGEWVDDAGSVFPGVRRIVKKRISNQWRHAVMGVDLAKQKDYTAIAVMNEDGAVIHNERFRRQDWGVVQARVVDLAQIYGAKVIVDATGLGDPIYDALVAEGLDVQGIKMSSAETKRQLVNSLQLAIEQEHIKLPDDPEMLEELECYEAVALPSGQVRYQAPQGGHADYVVALFLANWGRIHSLGPSEIACADIGGGTHAILDDSEAGVVPMRRRFMSSGRFAGDSMFGMTIGTGGGAVADSIEPRDTSKTDAIEAEYRDCLRENPPLVNYIRATASYGKRLDYFEVLRVSDSKPQSKRAIMAVAACMLRDGRPKAAETLQSDIERLGL